MRVSVRGGKAVVACAAVVSAIVWQGQARAGSDNSNDAWAGDVTLFALPPGTLIASEYLGYRHGDEYITSKNNVFATLSGGLHTIPSTVDIYTSISRLTYITNLMGQPLAFSAAATFARADSLNIGNLPAPIGGLGPQTVGNSFADPTTFISWGMIVDPRKERFLALTNYFYFPAGNYDKFKQFNFSTADQYTWVPQINYAEGLSKFGMRGLWFDLIANMSVHTDGKDPFALAPGVQFDKVSQDNSYDIKAFLRYNFNQLKGMSPSASKRPGVETRSTRVASCRRSSADRSRSGARITSKDICRPRCHSPRTSNLPPTSRMTSSARAAYAKTSRWSCG
jgi:outer membrane putative beta-barrel porin/alpha-amylase